MRTHLGSLTALLGLLAAVPAQAVEKGLAAIDTVVVIYSENRSFDNFYGHFPGAHGLGAAAPSQLRQLDRGGAEMARLPPIPKASGLDLPTRPFAIDDPKGLNLPLSAPTPDLVHRFYQNQMQIDGGRNDKFTAWSDAGGLVMGVYDGSKLPLWSIARQYTLADNFFMGAFGGSFLNHFWLVCACTPSYPNAPQALVSAVEADGVSLKVTADSPASALQGPPKWVNDGALTPDLFAVNTLQPPYQPSANKPAEGGDPRLADLAKPNTLPPQKLETIGELLSAKGISWAWYAGAWQAVLDGTPEGKAAKFQYHHHPFNYLAAYAPGTPARARHLLDGGMDGAAFLAAIDQGRLPQVSFYKPQGNLNEHPGYTDALSGDQHIATVIEHLKQSPQWKHMLVVVTYDENGGFWDHVAPPKGDRWGPGARVPTLIVSPFARKGFVDHTFYDTTSILRFLTRRFDLPMLPGLKERDEALAGNGNPAPGDLTNALELKK